MRRILLAAVLFFAAGIFLSDQIPLYFTLALLSAGFVIMPPLGLDRRLLLVLLLGWVLMSARTGMYEATGRAVSYDSAEAEAAPEPETEASSENVQKDERAEQYRQGIVLDAEPQEEGLALVILTEIGGYKARVHLRAYGRVAKIDRDDSGKGNVYDWIGTLVRFRAELSPPSPARNPRCFDYRRHLRTKGIALTGTAEYLREAHMEEKTEITAEGTREKEGERGQGERAFISSLCLKRKIILLREAFLDGLNCSEKARAMTRALLFGSEEGLTEETRQNFRDVGIAHILAVSGFHIGIVHLAYRRLRERLGELVDWVYYPFLILYGTAALWAPSVTRAILMIGLRLLADRCNRPYDAMTALSFVVLVTLIREPYMLFSSGLRMSVLAAAGMIQAAPLLKRYVAEGLAAALSVQMVMAPYLAYAYNTYSLVVMLANLPALFLAAPFMVIGVSSFCGFCSACLIGRGFYQSLVFRLLSACGPALTGLTALLEAVSALFASARALHGDLCPPPGPLLAGYYSVLAITTSETFQIHIVSRRNRRKLAAMAALTGMIVLTAVVSCASPFDRASLIFVDVGQGDCLHVKWRQGTDILIDGGGRETYNVGEKILKPYLLKNGSRDVELACATHLHTDHYRGLAELAACYPVEQLKFSGHAGERITFTEECYLEILWPPTAMLENREETASDELKTDKATGIPAPSSLPSDEENDRSMVFRIYDHGVISLVTGDTTENAEREILDYYEGRFTEILRCDILKIAHHGSRYSTSEAFLNACRPRLAVISVGKNNYGQPADEVIEKLASRGIIVYRTDRDGAVGIRITKEKIMICSQVSMRSDNLPRT